VNIASDGSSADVEYAFRDTADTGSVPIVEVTLEGQAAGETDISLGAAAGNDGVLVFDEAGTGYDVTGTTGATLTVEGDEPTPEPDPANFQVSNLGAPGSATQGDLIDVSAEVTNDGDETATKTVEFRVDADGDGDISDESAVVSQDVELAGGESTTVTFEDIDTSGLPVGTLTHGVATEDDSETAQITIESPPTPASFEVSNLQAPASAAPGETIDVSVEVTNEGDESATKTVAFRLDLNGDGDLTVDETVATEEVTLDAGDSTTVTFTPTVPEGIKLGEYAHGVFTDDDDATTTIRVAPPKLDPQFAGQPIDTDGDGTYEDVNGDGQVDEVDSQALFANLDDPTLDEYEAQFDYNGNGAVDVVDVQFHFANEIGGNGDSASTSANSFQPIQSLVNALEGWF
jgi:hypothetical protein